jgi:hypothetical protein
MLSKFLECNVLYVKAAEEFWLEQETFAGEIWFGADREGRGISTKLIQTDMPNTFFSDFLTLTYLYSLLFIFIVKCLNE